MTDAQSINVRVACQVVAAGIFDNKARVTLAFSPMAATDADTNTVDLARWPAEIANLLGITVGSSGSPAISIRVAPLGDKGWRLALSSTADDFDTTAKSLTMVTRIKAADLDELSVLWQEVMGGTTGLAAIRDLLGSNKETRDRLLRRSEDAQATQRTPDIHGTGRADVAMRLTVERASAIAVRALRPGRPPQRSKSLGRAARAYPSDLTLRALGGYDEKQANIEAWKDLKSSRQRADAIAAARRDYENASTSTAAIVALKQAVAIMENGESQAADMAEEAVKAIESETVPGAFPSEAVAAFRLASRPATRQADTHRSPKVEGAAPEDFTTEEMARRRFFALQSNPSLGRLFHFVIDAECDASNLDGLLGPAVSFYEKNIVDLLPEDGGTPIELDKMPQPRTIEARFALLGASLMFKSAGGGTSAASPPAIWTLAKHRAWKSGDSGQAGHFYPAAREEFDALYTKQDPRELGACDSIDAIIDLRQTLSFGQRKSPFNATPRYEILTLDPITSTGALDSKSRGPSTSVYASETRRSAGLALADRRRQAHAIARYCASESQVKRDQKGYLLVLDAADLTAGYKLDVGVRSTKDGPGTRSRWHTLMHRKVEYKLALTDARFSDFSGAKLEKRINALYPDADARREADDGLFHAPAAVREWTVDEPGWESGVDTATAFAEEIVGAWRGDPPGLSCGLEIHSLDPADLQFSIGYDLPTRSELKGALTPPPARYGWCYHLAARPVFLGGVSMPLERALGHYELSHIVDGNGSLVLPEARHAGKGFHRHERIEAPTIAVPEAIFGTPTPAGDRTSVALGGRYPAAQASSMVVRAITDPENRLLAGLPPNMATDKDVAGVGFDRRVLLIPSVPLDVAGLHGAFDALKDDDLDHDLKLAEPRLLMDDEEVTAPDEAEQYPPALAPEIVTSSLSADSGGPAALWVKKRVAWRALAVASRPRGGLKGFDYRAAWGGLPIFRAATAEPAPKPALGQRVVPWRGQTDQGEILHRTDDDIVIFRNDPSLKRTIHFSAVNAPSGAAVFRTLPKGRDTVPERTPYFPDPGANGLIVAVWFKGTETGAPKWTVPVKLYPSDGDVSGKPVPNGYPDALPLVLDLVRVDVAPDKDRIVVRGPQPYKGSPTLKAVYTEVRIAPGEELSIGVWALPSKAFLAHIFEATGTMLTLASAAKDLSPVKKPGSILEALAALATKGGTSGERTITGIGGLPAGYPTDLITLTETILWSMLKQPISEVAAVTMLDAIYAVDLPQALPSTDASGLTVRRLNPDTIEAVVGGRDCPAPSQLPDVPASDEDGATPVLLSGLIGTSIKGKFDALGPTAGALEITAIGSAAARGRFDDPDRGRSRDDIARGLWPRPDGVTPMSVRDLYGFALDADGYPIFRPETVRLLRLEGFPRNSPNDLLDLQRRARQADNGCPMLGDERLRAERPPAFPDARARYISIYAQAVSPHGGVLATRYGEAAPNIVAPARLPGELDDAKAAAVAAKPIQAQWLNATVRPSRPSGREPQPSFAWSYTPSPEGEGVSEVLIAHRSMMVRVRLARPWFSSGEGERLGLVIWPPNLPGLASADLRADTLRDLAPGRDPIDLLNLPSDGTNELYLQDADLGPGGPYVTRWGADPTRQDDGLKGWLMSQDNFPELRTALDGSKDRFSGPTSPRAAVFVRDVMMPLPVPEGAGGQSPARTMIVSLLTFAPRFDPEEETWYADIRIDPCSAVTPFVRLGLVRYQPHAASHLQVSEPVTQWVRILPDRELSVTGQRYTDKTNKMVRIQASVSGITDNGTVLPEMEFTLRRRRPDGEGDHSESEVQKAVVQPCCAGSRAEWSCSFIIAAAAYDKAGDQWFVTAAETELSRPGSYIDEPRYRTATEAPSARAGESFLVRMPLARLRTTVGKPPPEAGG
ncbi:hypothetical protein RFM99_27355 [Mesorhizobium sp. VK4C]|uniref:hypothetical protein n=1 Tax=Mesorhizobium captivum TaxID=3072319 RepID=UPI002A23CC32|nr:hypothetical protein [Mesorhizobium sp. VK4C]MDX8502118.1 hypothetical protein [Mesorhizobium sp. VK4C]